MKQKQQQKRESHLSSILFSSLFLFFISTCMCLTDKSVVYVFSCMRMREHVIIIKRVLNDTAHGIR